MGSKPSDTKQAILIAGMHRSGTSALARVVNLLGVPLGKQLAHEPAYDNEAGFWESIPVVTLHDRLFDALDSAWDDPRPFPENWLDLPSISPFRDRLSRVLEEQFGASGIWSVKDPRLCRFLLLWRQVLARKGTTPKLIFAMRHPDEVVASLVHRNELAPGVAAALWLRYLSDSVQATEGLDRCIVGYEELLDDWPGCMQRVASELDIVWPVSADACRQEVDAHLRKGLRHQHAGSRAEYVPGPWTDLLLGVHQAGMAVAHGKQDWAALRQALDDAWKRLDFAYPLWKAITPASRQQARERRLREAHDEAHSARDQLARSQGDLVQAQNRLGLTQSELSQSQNALTQAQADLQRLLAELVQTRTELGQARGDFDHSRRELKQVYENLEQAREGLTKTQEDYRQARAELQQSWDEHARTRGELEQVRTDFATVQRELKQVYGDLNQAREGLTKTQEDYKRARAELQQSWDEHARTREQLERARGDYAQLENRLESQLKRMHAERERAHVEHEKAMDEYMRNHEALQSELSEARNELMQVREVCEQQSTELLQVRGELARQAARAAMLDQVLTSRSWRWTRPLRFAMRVLRRGVSRGDRQQLKRMVQAKVPAPLKAGLPALATQREGLRDYFVWAVIDWHFRIQRPQHMARELARLGHRVFYISNNFIDRDDPGFAVEALDEDQRLFQINLHLKSSPAIYHAPPDETEKAQLRASLGRVLEWTRSRGCVSLVDHPYWLETARVPPGVRVVYDCMDHHGGFADNTADVLSREHELMRDADLLVVTSDWLEKETGKYNSHSVTVRNACEYTHFARAPQNRFHDEKNRRIIGYYGAIAAWFDLDLVEKVAKRFDDCLILLVGADTTDAARRRLGDLPNVQFTGEVPYADLPFYLYAFDVCMLPFQVIELTLATNPVKVYEYLSAGRSVVSVDLPEIRQFGDLVRRAAGHEEFLDAVSEALAHEPTAEEVQCRRKFASEQTWEHRVRSLDAHLRRLPDPRVSVVVVTYNNLDMTKACLDSLDLYSDYPNLEIVVVDNASADGTPDFLRQWVEGARNRKIILNEDNRGFAAANNQGLSASDGEYLVMLNNDTYVTPGWVATLVNHLRHNPDLGMLGPVTNNIGNEARIEIGYANMEDMLEVSGAYTRKHAGQLTPLQTAAFFCVMMPRRVYEKVGELDEAFGIGMFEDDDYCRRVHDQGWRVACAEDVFIHHHLSASFSKIKQEKRQEMFEANKRIYEAKWGPWVPHRYRESS